MVQRPRVVLISTYELGHQPFGLASPAAWLREAGARVSCLDLSVERLDEVAITEADLVAFYVPVNEEYLRELGAGTILGGEFEEGLVALVERLVADQTRPSPVGPQPEPA